MGDRSTEYLFPSVCRSLQNENDYSNYNRTQNNGTSTWTDTLLSTQDSMGWAGDDDRRGDDGWAQLESWMTCTTCAAYDVYNVRGPLVAWLVLCLVVCITLCVV